MAKKPNTPLHLTTNDGAGDKTLCGAAKRFTRQEIAAGTAHRYIDRDVFGPKYPGFNDPLLCADCAAAHESLPAPTRPGILGGAR